MQKEALFGRKKANLKLVKLAISGHFRKSSILQGRMVKIGRFKGFTSKEEIGSSEVPGSINNQSILYLVDFKL